MTDYSKTSILMVDDVPVNLVLVSKMLKRYNFRIRTAANGMMALDSVKAEVPDLILLDILMPVMDGFEVLQILRADPRTRDVRIVVLSALSANEDIVRAFNLGANDFITKPIAMEKLINCVDTQLQIIAARKEIKG